MSETSQTGVVPPLYKYAGPATTLAVLENQTLKFSRPGLFNDDFDVRINFALSINAETAGLKILDQMWETQFNPEIPIASNAFGQLMAVMRQQFPTPHRTRDDFNAFMLPMVMEQIERSQEICRRFSEELANVTSVLKVLCLSSTGISAPMWAHYAENRTGAALKFVGKKSLDSLFLAAKPVQYIEAIPPLISEQAFIDWMSARVALDEHSDTMLGHFIYSKMADWSYEKEWRLVAGNGWAPDAEIEYVRFNAQELEEIIIGTMTPTEVRRSIEAIRDQRYPNTPIRQLSRSSESYLLEIN